MTEFLTQDQRDLEGVGTIPWTGVNATLTRDAVSPIDGTQSLKVVADADGLMYVFPTASQFPVVSGVRTYWAHVRVRGPVGRAMQFWVRRWHADLVTYTDSVVEFTATGEIQQLANFITTVEDTPAIGMYVLDLASTTGSTYWIDGASLTDSLGFPDVIVEVAFTDGPLVENPTWTDISEWCYDVDVNRGRQRVTETFRAGTATVQVDNSDRRFDPSNEDSPYWPNVTPNKQIRIRARYPETTGTIYPLFRGLVDSWPIWWTKELGGATITATDKFKFWEQFPLEGNPYSISVLQDSPIGYWKMNETNQEQQAVDSSGNGRHGYYYGAPEFGIGDPITDGGVSAVNFGSWRTGQLGTLGIGPLNFGTDAYAVELWFQSPKMQGSALETSKFFWSIFDGTAFSTAILLDAFLPAASGDTPSGGLLRFFCPFVYLESTLPMDDGQWHHIVGQRLSGGTAELYIDGVLVDSDAPGSVAIASNQAWIGGISGNYVNAGTMDQVSIYDHSLSAARVAAHFNDRRAWEHDGTGERIERILDIIGEPAGMRDIDAGQSHLQGETELAGSALAHMQAVARSEFGGFYVDREGKARFRERHAFLYPPYTTVQATFTDEQGDDLVLKRYSSPRFEYDEATILNSVTVERNNGAPQTLKADASIVAYGERRHSETGLLNRNDNETRAIAWLIRERHADPFVEIPAITIIPSVDPNLWVTALELELENRYEVIATPAGGGDPIVREMHLQGIHHKVTADPPKWSVGLNFATAAEPPAQIWTLGTSALGVDTALVA